MFRARPIVYLLGVLFVILLTGPTRDAKAADDPFELVNRSVFAFNQTIRATALTPLTEAYLENSTPDFRRRLSLALANLGEPAKALSGLAAGRVDVAVNAAARFTINSTLGVLGTADPASAFGYERDAFSPGDMLCAWGLPSGPFLVLPLLGPTTLRDAGAGAVAGAVLSSAIGALIYGTATGFDAFHSYADSHRDAERLEANSIDLYALHRSVYLQRRARACASDEADLQQSVAGQFALDPDD